MPEAQIGVVDMARMRRLVHLSLLWLGLVHGSIVAIVAAAVQYDLTAATPWILHPTVTQVLGWMMALYGLFWIIWWFHWGALEGGRERIRLYTVEWAPVEGDFCREGPFEWLRYPLAFGYLEFLWGLGFLVQSTTLVLKGVPLLAAAVAIYLLAVAEPRKRRRHGPAYRAYCRETPLILPRIPPNAAILRALRRRRR
jgi:protein-S-isoprenylcysteine O-methyltransferase Ste14